MDKYTLGIISDREFNKDVNFATEQTISMETPYGKISSLIVKGEIFQIPYIHIVRYIQDDTELPAFINYRANMWALRKLACTSVMSIAEVTSLRKDIKPGELIVLDQSIDFTLRRNETFIEKGKENYNMETMKNPYCNSLRQVLLYAAMQQGINCHKEGIAVTIDGIRHATAAESHMYRIWGADVVSTTTATEAALAHELGIPYATLGQVRDYDSWNDETMYQEEGAQLINKVEIGVIIKGIVENVASYLFEFT